jgi:5'-nucleotidase
MRVLLTNDDGIDSPGLAALARALGASGHEVHVVAPAANQSAVARSITLGRDLVVEERAVDGAVAALAVDGTPVDCVRIALLGLVPRPEMVVSGANLGLNAGDDVTYSGTVAAALEGALMGLPAIASSQQSVACERGWLRQPGPDAYDFEAGADFVARLVGECGSSPWVDGLVLNVNCPGSPPTGAELTRLGKRIYFDDLVLREQQGARRRYSVYGADASHHPADGTDFAALAEGRIAVTPLRFHLDLEDAAAALPGLDLATLVRATGQ